jgi:predicted ATP-grasp superfamily ATP-dependent carboligase
MIQEIIPGGRQAVLPIMDGDSMAGNRGGQTAPKGVSFGDGLITLPLTREVANLSRRLLAAFGYKGCSHVEFKLDPRDQSYRLMEINARAGLSTSRGLPQVLIFPGSATSISSARTSNM